MIATITHLLSRFPDLQRCSTDSELQVLSQSVTPQRIPPGQIILREDDAEHPLYLVCSGNLLSYLVGYPSRMELCQLAAGDFAGEDSLLDDGPAITTVETQTACILLALPQVKLAEISEQHPQLHGRIVRAVIGQLTAQLGMIDTLLNDAHLQPPQPRMKTESAAAVSWE